MPSRFEWSEIFIIGLVAGVAGACITLAFRLGASVDNFLNFFGGAVGSGTAVVATLWLESHRRALALEQTLTSLVITANVAMKFQSISSQMIIPLIVTFQQSAEAFEASRLGTTIRDPIHQYGFQAAIFWLKRSLSDVNSGMDDLAAGRINEQDLTEKCQKSAAGTVGAIEDFLKIPGLPKSPLEAFRYHKTKAELGNSIDSLTEPATKN